MVLRGWGGSYEWPLRGGGESYGRSQGEGWVLRVVPGGGGRTGLLSGPRGIGGGGVRGYRGVL